MKRTIPTSKWSGVLIWGAAMFAISPVALAQHPIPEAERWATITHPGNAPYTIVDPSGYPDRYVGQVNHEYQIGRTEVTNGEWIEFVRAYAPFAEDWVRASIDLRGSLIHYDGGTNYSVSAANENRGIEIGWRYAARYVNWLHNDKALTAGAFENGAYDTSTFGEIEDVGYTDQIAHSPGARYWIPTSDEWLKSAHFDPDRHGPGMPGYWLYSHSSDVAPLRGSPTNGGETSTGDSSGGASFSLPSVAAYINVQSPWGLWDTSGSFREWTESPFYLELDSSLPYRRMTQGSEWRDHYTSSIEQRWDQIDGVRSGVFGGRYGLRIARAVPGPCSAGAFACALSLVSRRRRRFHDTLHSDAPRSACPVALGSRR